MANALNFLRQFVAHPSATGAIAPSSIHLAREMASWFDWDTARLVVEFGPGTGAFTGEILKHRRPATEFFAIEQNEDFAEIMRRKYPTVTTHCDSVANVSNLCAEAGFDSDGTDCIDGIICGLPWAAFSEELQDELLSATLAALRPGGRFATFAYLQGTLLPAGIRLQRKLDSLFTKIEKSPIVWRNLPPAFIYRCTA